MLELIELIVEIYAAFKQLGTCRRESLVTSFNFYTEYSLLGLKWFIIFNYLKLTETNLR